MADPRGNFRRWLLIDGNRHAVATLFLLAAFVVLAVLALLGTISLEAAAVRGIAGGFVPGLIAFLSIVLAINQLVLTQELGSAGEIRDRIQEVRRYRHDVEVIAGTGPSPILPTGFLAFVVETIEAEAVELEASVQSVGDPDLRATVETYAEGVAEEASQARESLDQVRPGRINALLPVLEYDDSRQLLAARRLQNRDDELPDETLYSLSRLVDTLELFSVARTQFRSTYTQRVLSRLSRHLLYVGLPALLVAVLLGLVELPASSVQPRALRIAIVSASIAVVLAPLAVLAAYLLRVATVSERTISVGPFVSRPGTGPRDRHSEREE